MKLAFLGHPVKDLTASFAYYQALEFEEAWREGDHPKALTLPGTDVQLLIGNDEPGFPAGENFVVDSVDDYYDQHREKLDFIKVPCDIPPGRYSIFQDDSGNVIRILDMSADKGGLYCSGADHSAPNLFLTPL